eukprot:15205039-Ditylum_brightwellii.AAC.1
MPISATACATVRGPLQFMVDMNFLTVCNIASSGKEVHVWFVEWNHVTLSQLVPTRGLYTEILACLGTDEIQRRSKVMPYVRYQYYGAGSRLRESEVDPK